jgi:hypothetical protein
MVLAIAAILTAYISALMLSNQAFAQSAAGQEAKQFPGGQLGQLPGGHGINPGGPIIGLRPGHLHGGHSLGDVCLSCWGG